MRGLESLLGAAGLLCIAWWVVSLASAAIYQGEAAHLLESWRPEARPVPTRAPPPRGTGGAAALTHASGIVGRIVIPSARISAIIGEGADARTLGRAVGHLPGTALPGETGRVVLAGHRDTFFRGLGRLRPGDAIRLSTPDGRFDYAVETMQILSPRAMDEVLAERSPGLTLITCYPFHFLGPAPMRFVVRASALGPSVAARAE